MPLTKLHIDDFTAVISFDNPPRGYMTGVQVDEVAALVDRVDGDDTVRTVIFTGGVPGVFIRHYDVAEIVAAAVAVRRMDGANTPAGSTIPESTASRLFRRIANMVKPTVAAINGYCQGAGFELALCCDLRIAEAGDYRIGLPESNLGIFPGGGGTQRLPRLVGEARALELILRGLTLTPEAAAAAGLIHETVAPGGALARAREIAREFQGKSPAALASAKALVRNAPSIPLDEGLDDEQRRIFALLAHVPEATEAMQRFLDTGEDINRR